MQARKASIKETGDEVSQAEWERFDAAVAAIKKERPTLKRRDPASTADRDKPAKPRG